MTRVWLFFAVISCGTPAPPVTLEAQALDLKPIVDDVERALNDAAGGKLVTQAHFGTDVVWDDTFKCGYDSGVQKIALARACAKGYGDEAIRVVLVHEVGHLLGLEHSTNRHSVMYGSLDPNMSLATAVQSLLADLQHSTTILLPPNAP